MERVIEHLFNVYNISIRRKSRSPYIDNYKSREPDCQTN